jgi:hypothetical protein
MRACGRKRLVVRLQGKDTRDVGNERATRQRSRDDARWEMRTPRLRCPRRHVRLPDREGHGHGGEDLIAAPGRLPTPSIAVPLPFFPACSARYEVRPPCAAPEHVRPVLNVEVSAREAGWKRAASASTRAPPTHLKATPQAGSGRPRAGRRRRSRRAFKSWSCMQVDWRLPASASLQFPSHSIRCVQRLPASDLPHTEYRMQTRMQFIVYFLFSTQRIIRS